MADTMDAIRQREPTLWLNPRRAIRADVLSGLSITRQAMDEAEQRLLRFAPLLATFFPELADAGGIIESPLIPVPKLEARLRDDSGCPELGNVYVKADHLLPVAGSIKARGGIYAVLCVAERLALDSGLLAGEDDDIMRLRSDPARALFGNYQLTVGSTGNLGLSIGIMGSALGFRVAVHMSTEAKEWKKERLRQRGVQVVEHATDYTAACVVARAEAEADDHIFFIDDENSEDLFLGYSVAVKRLRGQLADAGIGPDRDLLFYLPCGVGGAPGGITFGAAHVFGDRAHCFFVEPVEAPCMLVGMASGRHSDISVYDVGLKLQTDADGLAVSTPSRFIGRMMEPLISGIYTETDETFYNFVKLLYDLETLEVEPSAAAGCVGPLMLLGTEQGRRYLEKHGMLGRIEDVVHIIWTTGGLFVPPEQHALFRSRGANIRS